MQEVLYTCPVGWDGAFEWDSNNLPHCQRHGVTPELVDEISLNQPRLFPDDSDGHSGSDFMIGPDDDGRMWTIVLLSHLDNTWRPITGWPSTNTEIRQYREVTDE
jgi:uncharacterized DUF497 family protein